MAIWQDNLEIRRRVNGPDHFLVAHNLQNISCAYGELGDMPKCRSYFEEGHAHREKHNPGDLYNSARYLSYFATFLLHNGELEGIVSYHMGD